MIRRSIEDPVRQALADTPVVLLNGALKPALALPPEPPPPMVLPVNSPKYRLKDSSGWFVM